MIPYELIITSASRPSLLRPTLESLLANVDQPPERILVHDDALYGDADERWEVMKEMLASLALPCELLVTHVSPPRRLGLALSWLLANVRTEYVLYSQDDFVTVRPLPVRAALSIMNVHGINQIRFNKRATLGQKDTWQGVWSKEERGFTVEQDAVDDGLATEVSRTVLTVSDHWYFQTGLWRASVIRAALAWLTATPERARLFAATHAEVAINSVMDGVLGPIPGLSVPRPEAAADLETRRRVQRTFIWGPIGEDRYVRHVGVDREHWAGDHSRGPAAPSRLSEKQREAWAEVESYQREEREDGH